MYFIIISLGFLFLLYDKMNDVIAIEESDSLFCVPKVDYGLIFDNFIKKKKL